MLVKYYKDNGLAYTNRKRYRSFSFKPFATENQKSILLGDGATTTIKTKKDNICNYVTINDTRWYVTSYVYLNGGQVQLNLQRDVIGEFGLGDCYGKVERGYTDNFLKYRKELSLNQILKERKKLIPANSQYGNYNINTHDNEMWGIIYLTNSSDEGDNKVNINIPEFNNIETINIDYIPNGTSQTVSVENIENGVFISFVLEVLGSASNHKVSIDFKYNLRDKKWDYFVYVEKVDRVNLTDAVYYVDVAEYGEPGFATEQDFINIASAVGILLARGILSENGTGLFQFPAFNDPTESFSELNEFIVLHEEKYFSYNVSSYKRCEYGRSLYAAGFFLNYVKTYVENKEYAFSDTEKVVFALCGYAPESDSKFTMNNSVVCTDRIYNCKEVAPSEAGILTLDLTRNLIDEPFTVVAVPLFDVKISGSGENYNISRENAFYVFNKVIQYLSGQTPYLVDAQIYPYCPVLTSCGASLKGKDENIIPFFTIQSSCYEHICSVDLLPSSDIKKEYIQRSYSIISPEQSGKFTFDFYDYVNTIYDNNGVNEARLYIKVKTALKPFSIISSAVIEPEAGSLYGLTYSSDLRGCQPSSNGFECSLASNAFQEYKRQNSNYQQIFALQKGELEKQHEVEVVNETTSMIINTASASAMGAIAGSSMAGGGWTGVSGAIAGGVSAGSIVGSAMNEQININNSLREYEKQLQQQTFDLQIGTIKNLPNSINRISSFNEIIIKDFCYVVEVYECSDREKQIVDDFISKYGYGIGVFGYLLNYKRDGWFLRGTLVSSSYNVNLHLIAEKELMGGIYLYEQV